MPFIQIKTIQTRDCYYPIYQAINHHTYISGYYFFDEEIEEIYNREGDYGMGYFGPYQTLDDVCRAQYRHYQSIQSL